MPYSYHKITRILVDFWLGKSPNDPKTNQRICVLAGKVLDCLSDYKEQITKKPQKYVHEIRESLIYLKTCDDPQARSLLKSLLGIKLMEEEKNRIQQSIQREKKAWDRYQNQIDDVEIILDEAYHEEKKLALKRKRERLIKERNEVGENLRQLEEQLTEIEEKLKATEESSKKKVDFLIITPLKDELNQVISKLSGKNNPLPDDIMSSHTQYTIEVSTKNNAIYQVVIAHPKDKGQIDAGILVNSLIKDYHPQCILLVGIAAGIKGVVELGDMIIANQVIDCSRGKKVNRKWECTSPKVHQVDPILLKKAQELDKNWHNSINKKPPKKRQPKSYYGVIISLSDTIKDKEVMEYCQEEYKKFGPVLGVEMESGAASTAIHGSPDSIRFLMIRAISDFGDENKNDPEVKKWRNYAFDVVTSYMISFLKSCPINPQ